MGGEAKHLLWFEFDKTVKPTVSACLQEPPAKKTTSSAGEARCFRGRNPDGFRLEPRSGISDITVDDLKRNYSGFKVPKAQYLTHGPVEPLPCCGIRGTVGTVGQRLSKLARGS